MRFEFSAGGIVVDGDRVLLVRTRNLDNKQVWTFPKGHIEKKEKAVDTALREVSEETGYACEALKIIDEVSYFFKDEGELVKKTVKWFLMKAIKKICRPDGEIDEIKWVEIRKAGKLLTYISDKKIIKKIKPQWNPNSGL